MTGVTWGEILKLAGESGFTPLPSGSYDMYVETATAKQASSGKDMIALRFKVESGPHEGRNVFSNIVISPESEAALGFLMRKLAAFGLDHEYFAAISGQSVQSTISQVAADLENRRCVAEVTIREFGGQERNDVNAIKPPADGVTHHASGPVPDTALGVFGSFTQNHGSHSPQSPASQYTPPDLPF